MKRKPKIFNLTLLLVFGGIVLVCFFALFFPDTVFADCPPGFRRVKTRNPFAVVEICVQSAQEAGYAPGESWAEYITENGGGIDATWIVEWLDDPLPVSGLTTDEQQVKLPPPSPTPVPPTNTPVPPSPTPVPTAIPPTPTPMVVQRVVVVEVTAVPTNPPPATATAVPVVQTAQPKGRSLWEQLGDFITVCVVIVVGLVGIVLAVYLVGGSILWLWNRRKEEQKRDTERRREKQEEARRRFDGYVAKAKNALRNGRLEEAREAIRNADALCGAHPEGAEIVAELNAERKRKELRK